MLTFALAHNFSLAYVMCWMCKIDRTGLEIADALLSLLVVASTEANMPCAAVTHLGELAPDYTHLYLKVANAFACIQNCPRTVLQRIKPLLHFPLKGSLFIPAAVMHQSTTVLYMRSHPQEEALAASKATMLQLMKWYVGLMKRRPWLLAIRQV